MNTRGHLDMFTMSVYWDDSDWGLMGALWRVGWGQGVSDSDLYLYVQVISHHPLTKSKEGCNASVWNQYVSAVTFMNFIGVVNVNNTSLFLSTDDNRAYIIMKDTHTQRIVLGSTCQNKLFTPKQKLLTIE